MSISKQVLEENRPAGVVGQLSTDWFSSSSPISYSLVSGLGSEDNVAFTVSSTGVLSSIATFDADLQPERSIRVRASNGDGVIVEQSIKLRIRDLFDGVERVELNGNRVAENSPVGTVIGTLTSQAPQGVSVTYVLVSVNGQSTNLPLAIVGNQVRVAGPLDYELQPTVPFVVRATGSNGSVALEELTIHLTNVNENATAPILISHDSVDENQIFEGILFLPNSTASWTFSLVAGAGAFDNAKFSIAGDRLQLQENPDYELRDDYSVRVRATSGLNVIEAALTVVITPVDEFDPQDILFISDFGTINWPTLYENIPRGEVAARLKVVDDDRGENYHFEGQFTNGELLGIVQGDALYSVLPANFERDNDTATAFVSATFGNKSIGRSGGASVTVIGNRNDPPVVEITDLEQDVTADNAAVFSLPTGIFSDEDFVDVLTITASYNSGALPAWLTFSSSSLEFTASPTLADAGQYFITLTATDSAGAQASTTLVLTVLSGQTVNVAGTPGNDNFTLTSLGGAAGNWRITRNGATLFTGPFTAQTPVQISDVGGNDTVVVLASTGTNTIEIRDGQIRVDGRRVLFDGVESQTVNGRGGNDTFRVLAASVAARAPQSTGVSIIGGPGSDTLIGGNIDNLWTVLDNNAGQLNAIQFNGIENLIGGSNNDQFRFVRRGSISGALDGRRGYNTLDYTADNSSTSIVISSLVPELPTTGSATGIDSFSNIQQFQASTSAGGRVTGPAAPFPFSPVQWQVSEADGYITAGFARTVELRGFDRYRGGQRDDTFQIVEPLGSVEIEGGGGVDEFVYTSPSTEPIIDLSQQTASGVNRFTDIEKFTNTQFTGEIRGLNSNTIWQIDAQAGQITNSQGFTFSGFANIAGGSASDSFNVAYGYSMPLTLRGNGGSDTLRMDGVPIDTSSWSLTGVGAGTVFLEMFGIATAFSSIENLVTNSYTDIIDFVVLPTREWFTAITSVAGNLTQIRYPGDGAGLLQVNVQDRWANGIRRFDGEINFVSQTPNSRLIGRNANVNWTIDTAAGQVLDGNVVYTGFNTILAGSGNDQFFFTTSEANSILGPLRIDGGEGRNTLDFSGYSIGVSVDLQAGTASVLPEGISRFVDVIGSAFDDVINGNAQNNWLYGFGGNDILRGQQGDDVLLGGTGNDWLYGGTGEDLLVGGSGQDWLYGGSGDDLLIGGKSQLLVDEDASDGLQVAALQAVMAEWTSGRSYSNRTSRLRSGVGPGGSIRLSTSTIASDNEIDRLFGETGDDWFWRGSEDLAPDINTNRERQDLLS